MVQTPIYNVVTDKCIYTPVPPLPSGSESRTVPLATLIEMSREENRLRLDEAFQQRFRDAYARAAAGPPPGESLQAWAALSDGTMDIIEEMQKDVVARHGFARGDRLALYELQTAAMQYPDEPVFQESIYIRYNRCGDVDLHAGDAAPNVTLTDPDTLAPTTLHDFIDGFAPKAIALGADGAAALLAEPAAGDAAVEARPLVLITGSYS
jgi:hypothetical protein